MVGVGSEPGGLNPASTWGQHAEEQARVLVEAVVEVLLREHPADVVDEVALVDVRLVAESPGEPAEAQHRRQNEDEGEGCRFSAVGPGEVVLRPAGGMAPRGRVIIPSVEMSMALALTGTLLAAQASHRRGSHACRSARPPRGPPSEGRARPDGPLRPVLSVGSPRLEVVERGTLAIKKPGRMRWEYKEPEHKLFVSDGKQFFSSTYPRTARSSSRSRPESRASRRSCWPGRESSSSSRCSLSRRWRAASASAWSSQAGRGRGAHLPRRGRGGRACARSRCGRAGRAQPLPVRGREGRTSGCPTRSSGSTCPGASRS
mgnify:CR=1 FL=1